MKTLQVIKKLFLNGCVYYTAIALAMILLNLAIGAGSDAPILASSFLLLFPASLCFSAGGLLLSNKKLSFPLRALLHYGITLLTVFVFLWLPANMNTRGMVALVLFGLFTLLYWLVFLTVHLIQKRVRRLLEETKE